MSKRNPNKGLPFLWYNTSSQNGHVSKEIKTIYVLPKYFQSIPTTHGLGLTAADEGCLKAGMKRMIRKQHYSKAQ